MSAIRNPVLNDILKAKKGLVGVVGSSSTNYYQCVANGSHDDRATINTLLQAAIADMPAVVTFGPGDYGISGGIEALPTQGSRGLTIQGAGANVTRLRFTGGVALTATQYIALRVFPSTDPETGLHSGADAQALLTDSDGSFTVDALIGLYVHNLTDKSVATITDNDATTITGTLAGGTNNDWDTDDEYVVSDSADDPYSLYLKDIHFKDIGFFDDDPVNHEGAGGEESHGIGVKFAQNVSVRDCAFVDIGDEGVDLSNVIRGTVSGCVGKNTPSLGAAGSVISISGGSRGISITNNTLSGTKTDGVKSSVTDAQGISVTVVAATTQKSIRDVTISGNTIQDFVHGIYLGASDTTNASDLSAINMTGNTIRNCTVGITRSGESGVSYEVSVVANTITEMSDTGIDFDVAAAYNINFNLSFNTIRDCTTTGISANGTNGMLSGNLLYNCERGVHIFVGDDICISGGVFDACGGAAKEEIEAETATNITVSGVLITNSVSTASCIKGCDDVHNCVIEHSTGASQYGGINQCVNATGNRLTDTGIRPLSTATGGIIANNHISYPATTDGGANSREAIILQAGNNDYVISGNSIDTSNATNNQYCIEVQAGATNTVIVGNNLKATTAGATNCINDAGTGTIWRTYAVLTDETLNLPLNSTT